MPSLTVIISQAKGKRGTQCAPAYILPKQPSLNWVKWWAQLEVFFKLQVQRENSHWTLNRFRWERKCIGGLLLYQL